MDFNEIIESIGEPYYHDDSAVIYCVDCRDILKKIPKESVDLLLTDPPYGIGFMGKDWDKALPDKEIWQECLRVLKDGAFAFVMSIPRADCLSRMIISLEDAGFKVNFTPIFWAYASGFPKAQNIGKAVDKRLGVEREKILKPIAYRDSNCWGIPNKSSRGNQWGIVQADDKGKGKRQGIQGMVEDSLPSSSQAKALDGSYGGFQPKPALEVIIVAMKPLSEKIYVDQALKNRKGITWLDSVRIPFVNQKDIELATPASPSNSGGILNWHQGQFHRDNQGRFPANLLVSDDVLNVESRGAFAPVKSGQKPWGGEIYGKFASGGDNGKSFYGDSGSFSRYFSLDSWWTERIKQLPASVQKTFPFLIVPKASKSEKNKGCEDLPIGIKQSMGDYGEQSQFKCPDGVHRVGNKGESKAKNCHPTTKPLKLMSYLITLGSREGDIILDPFVGSGTTALACQLLSRKTISIEISEEYCEIARKRLSQAVMLL